MPRRLQQTHNNVETVKSTANTRLTQADNESEGNEQNVGAVEAVVAVDVEVSNHVASETPDHLHPGGDHRTVGHQLAAKLTPTFPEVVVDTGLMVEADPPQDLFLLQGLYRLLAENAATAAPPDHPPNLHHASADSHEVR